MTKLIEKDDPLWFGQTSNEPYDRHYYKIVYKHRSLVVKSWDEVQEHWCNKTAVEKPVIEVLDKPKKSNGFK